MVHPGDSRTLNLDRWAVQYRTKHNHNKMTKTQN